tara:strand:+ start:660 stop:941 length:282 start_codon:yes stop_codon:yes gene_type:complete
MTYFHQTFDGVVEFTEEEVTLFNAEEAAWEAGADDRLAAEARDKRNDLLAATDWTAMADAPTQATEMTTYRQALRDITSQSGWPITINWPTAP